MIKLINQHRDKWQEEFTFESRRKRAILHLKGHWFHPTRSANLSKLVIYFKLTSRETNETEKILISIASKHYCRTSQKQRATLTNLKPLSPQPIFERRSYTFHKFCTFSKSSTVFPVYSIYALKKDFYICIPTYATLQEYFSARAQYCRSVTNCCCNVALGLWMKNLFKAW